MKSTIKENKEAILRKIISYGYLIKPAKECRISFVRMEKRKDEELSTLWAHLAMLENADAHFKSIADIKQHTSLEPGIADAFADYEKSLAKAIEVTRNKLDVLTEYARSCEVVTFEQGDEAGVEEFLNSLRHDYMSAHA